MKKKKNRCKKRRRKFLRDPCLLLFFKNLLMPLFLLGCFPGDFQEGKRPIKAFWEAAHSGRKRPIKERKRPISASGQFSGTPPRWKTAPLKRPIKRSMRTSQEQRKGRGLLEGDFAEMCASLGCSALSAKCAAESNVLGWFLFSLVGPGFCRKTPFDKPPPCYWFLNF